MFIDATYEGDLMARADRQLKTVDRLVVLRVAFAANVNVIAYAEETHWSASRISDRRIISSRTSTPTWCAETPPVVGCRGSIPSRLAHRPESRGDPFRMQAAPEQLG